MTIQEQYNAIAEVVKLVRALELFWCATEGMRV